MMVEEGLPDPRGRVAVAPPATHYDALGVSPTATRREIKEAYRCQARRHHPDRTAAASAAGDSSSDPQTGGDSPVATAFHHVQQAWECLQDPKRRQEYDQQLWIQARQARTKRLGLVALSAEDCQWQTTLATADEGIGDREGSSVLLFTCRCGEELHVLEDSGDDGLMECFGCSLVYDTADLLRRIRTN